ncbi:hypothetical protein [Thiothrix sp.]|jgi:hypothetical protein|uniref:hypothetical protein n=1 Tax=Thiothrix sp. TaxID=1032 RepID=UPI00257F3FEA|nr:hypothetical protein [Thiothrix sp.]
MNMKKTIAAISLLALLPLSVSYADSGLVLTWKNKAGYWFACGPVQCLATGYDSEREAINLVHNDRRHDLRAIHDYRDCGRYVVSEIESYDFSSEKVERLSKCD